jgi:hypothetical protein
VIGSHLVHKAPARIIGSIRPFLHTLFLAGANRLLENSVLQRLPLGMTIDLDNDDDDDDVLILSDEASSEAKAASLDAVSPSKKRAHSLGDMDLDYPQFASTIPPELSHTVASSSTSSLLSLFPPVMLPPSTREEKVIAALTLALANGAAGINDYSAVREALGASAALTEGASEVGEMWR